MRCIYYIDGEKFTTDNYDDIMWDKISSLNEQTPAYEDLSTGEKLWYNKGLILHRLTGPTYFRADGSYAFWLNDKKYDNVEYWLKDHPNQDNAFQVEMVLKYT
jgi:hypothetical protein